MCEGIRGRARERVVAAGRDRRPRSEHGSVERGRHARRRVVRPDDRRDGAVERDAGRDRNARLQDLDRGSERLHLEGEREGRAVACPIDEDDRDGVRSLPRRERRDRESCAAHDRGRAVDGGAREVRIGRAAEERDRRAERRAIRRRRREEPRRRDVDREERVGARLAARAVHGARHEKVTALGEDRRSFRIRRAVQRQRRGGRRRVGAVGDLRPARERAAEERGRLSRARRGARGTSRERGAVEEEAHRRKRRLHAKGLQRGRGFSRCRPRRRCSRGGIPPPAAP